MIFALASLICAGKGSAPAAKKSTVTIRAETTKNTTVRNLIILPMYAMAVKKEDPAFIVNKCTSPARLMPALRICVQNPEAV